jgi:hypothetical protein
MSNYAPMNDDEFDPANLDPGIRATVLWLRERGFKTCDSGDGTTKIEAGYNDLPEGESAPKPGEVSCEAIPVPHVIIATTPESMVADALRLADALREVGVELDAESGKTAQAMFCPTQKVAIIELYNVML